MALGFAVGTAAAGTPSVRTIMSRNFADISRQHIQVMLCEVAVTFNSAVRRFNRSLFAVRFDFIDSNGCSPMSMRRYPMDCAPRNIWLRMCKSRPLDCLLRVMDRRNQAGEFSWGHK